MAGVCAGSIPVCIPGLHTYHSIHRPYLESLAGSMIIAD